VLNYWAMIALAQNSTTGLPQGIPVRRTGSPAQEIQLRPLSEVVMLFSGIMIYIWGLRSIAPWSWIVLWMFVIASHVYYRENLQSLGLSRRNLARSIKFVAPWTSLICFLVLSIGLFLGHRIFPPLSVHMLYRFGLAMAWGVFQQYLLNAYFANRLARAVPRASTIAIAILASGLFTLAHAPNPYLMTITFFAGVAAILVYARYRNLVAVGLAHGFINFSLTLAFPSTLLYVGPRYLR